MHKFFLTSMIPALLLGCSADVGNVFGGGTAVGGESAGAGDVGGNGTGAGGDGSGAGAVGGNNVGGSNVGGSNVGGSNVGGSNVGGGDPTGGQGGAQTGGQGPGGGGQGSGGQAPFCGDGVRNGAELCDGQDLDGMDCKNLGFGSPAGLACTGNCTFDTSDCATCGNGQVEPGELCDDNNDSPYDACDSCVPRAQATCNAPYQLSLSTAGMVVRGTTFGVSTQATDWRPCSGGGAGPESVFAITPSANGFLTAHLDMNGTNFDSMLYVTQSCGSEALLCHDTGVVAGGGEMSSFRVASGQTYYLVLDGWSQADVGEFELELGLHVGTCGDPVAIQVDGDGPLFLAGRTNGEGDDSNASQDCNEAGGGPDVVYEVTYRNGGQANVRIESNFNDVLYAQDVCGDPDEEIECSSFGEPAVENLQFSVSDGDTVYTWADGVSGAMGMYLLQFETN